MPHAPCCARYGLPGDGAGRQAIGSEQGAERAVSDGPACRAQSRIEFDGLARCGRARLNGAETAGLGIYGQSDPLYNAACALAPAAPRRHGYRSENRLPVLQCVHDPRDLPAENCAGWLGRATGATSQRAQATQRWRQGSSQPSCVMQTISSAASANSWYRRIGRILLMPSPALGSPPQRNSFRS